MLSMFKILLRLWSTFFKICKKTAAFEQKDQEIMLKSYYHGEISSKNVNCVKNPYPHGQILSKNVRKSFSNCAQNHITLYEKVL